MTKKKILVIDDEPEVVEMMKTRLETNNYQVITAYDGQEGLEKARSEKPDLILLDIRMPKLDGLEVAKEIRKFNTQAKIVLLTAFESPELVKEATKYDIFDYIVKTASARDILIIVKNALST